MCHCGLLCCTLNYLAIHIQNAHSDGLYACIHYGTQLSTKRIAWKHVRTVHVKRFLHHCMYMDAKDLTKECSYGCDELDIIQTNIGNNHGYFSPIVCDKCGRQLSSKNALGRHMFVCKKIIGERKSHMCTANGCSRSYTTAAKLKLHIDTHNADAFISSTTSMKTKKRKGREKIRYPQEKDEEKWQCDLEISTKKLLLDTARSTLFRNKNMDSGHQPNWYKRSTWHETWPVGIALNFTAECLWLLIDGKCCVWTDWHSTVGFLQINFLFYI